MITPVRSARCSPRRVAFPRCYNAVDVEEAPFRAGSEGYLAFVGRMAPEKGAAEAIALARDAGV